MRLNLDTDWFNNNKLVKVKNPSENYLFLNVMVNFVIVNQKLTGSALHIEKNQTIRDQKFTNIIFFFESRFFFNTCSVVTSNKNK